MLAIRREDVERLKKESEEIKSWLAALVKSYGLSERGKGICDGNRLMVDLANQALRQKS